MEAKKLDFNLQFVNTVTLKSLELGPKFFIIGLCGKGLGEEKQNN